MTLWQLLLMAKEAEKMHDDGLISVSAYAPAVFLTERAFTEIFPVGWSEGEPFESIDREILRSRAIEIDGVTFTCVKKV